jgi:hypothetical protein
MRALLGLLGAIVLVAVATISAWAIKSGAFRFVPLTILIPAGVIAFFLVIACARAAKKLLIVGAAIGAIGAVIIIYDTSGRAEAYATKLCAKAAAELHSDPKGCGKIEKLTCLRHDSSGAYDCIKERLGPATPSPGGPVPPGPSSRPR